MEQLETRSLLSASDLFISEVHYRPKFGDLIEDQYLEIRGEPNATIANGTYFVSVESDGDNGLDNPGGVNSFFDLGGLTLGPNGYAAFIQENSGYVVDSDATMQQGTQGGFKGLPDDRYTGFTGQFESVSGSESFLLVTSPTAPTTSLDIDIDDDGVIDPAIGWTVVDSVTVFKQESSPITGDLAYGNIIFRSENNNSANPGGVTDIYVEELGYVARVGTSSGYYVGDWIGAITREKTGGAFNFEITDGDYAMASPAQYSGRDLDHLGSQNFLSSVSGSAPTGATIFVDRNNNDSLDSYQFVAEPDDRAPTIAQTNEFAAVTINGVSTDNVATGFPITSRSSSGASTGSLVFAYSGNASFSDLFRLRADFYQPVESVSIDFIGLSNSNKSIGRMEAYDAGGTLIDTFVSGEVGQAEVTALTVTSPTSEIAWVVAYPDPTSPNGSGYLDYLRFTQAEESAVADPNGAYHIEPVAGIDETVLVKNLATLNTEAVIIERATAAEGVDFSGVASLPMDVVGRDSNGDWNVALFTPGGFVFETWGHWSNSVVWEDVLVADIDGNGLDDVVGRTSGDWWVARNSGTDFSIEYWGRWSDSISWQDVVIGDFDNDGLEDIAGRGNGQWWVARSTGTYFQTSYWGNWSNAVTWEDVMVGDFDGTGGDDIAGRANGQWWVSRSQGSFFAINYWGNWSNGVTWEDVMVADLDDDNRDDIVGRANGQWWVSRSTGTFFSITYWGSWSNALTWDDVMIADVNGDSRADIVGRTSGNWWVSRSNGTNFVVEYWGSWSNAVSWQNVMALDLDGDRMDDLVGRTGSSWWGSISVGDSFGTVYLGNSANSPSWQDVQPGQFD